MKKRNDIKKLTLSAMFLALAFVMPFLTGQIPQIGSMLCPMHIPVLLCGFFCGAPLGLVVGFIAPILRSFTLGMPPMFPTAFCMAFELATYGFNFIRYRNSKQAYPDPDFYMTYSWPYTSYIIKKNLKDVFYNNIFHDEGKEKSELLDDTSYEFFDQMGMTLYQKLDPVMGTTEAQDNDGNVQNKLCDLFDETMAIIDEGATENIPKSDREQARELEERDCANLSDLLIYLTACDIQDGWSLKPGYVAPIVASETNLAVEKLECSGIKHDKVTEGDKNSQSSKDIFDLRKQAIQAIDDYLSDPIDYGRYSRKNSSDFSTVSGTTSVYIDISKTVDTFCSEEKAKKIFENLTALSLRGNTITEQNVDYILSLSFEEKENEVLEIEKDLICHTIQGKPIKPKTVGQKKYVDAIRKQMITFGLGPAGTGKTYLAMAMAITAFKNNEVGRIILTRPAIEAGEKLGFLPGDLQSKIDPYLRPLYDALYQIMGAEAFIKNSEKGLIEVAPLAYMRGRTLDNAFIILDEAQNTTPAENKTPTQNTTNISLRQPTPFL